MSDTSGDSRSPNQYGQYPARSYQLEMLEESLRTNIIVAVLTASYYAFCLMVTKTDGYRERQDAYVSCSFYLH